MFDLSQENIPIDSDVESLSQINIPLINIWIPSVFLRSDKSGSHHVYQVFYWDLISISNFKINYNKII